MIGCWIPKRSVRGVLITDIVEDVEEEEVKVKVVVEEQALFHPPLSA
jgi:hypothetical protein